MVDPLVKKIDHLLREGQTKKNIWNKLKDSEDSEEVAFLLNERPTLKNRKNFLLLHLPLTAILVILTGKKLFAAAAIGQVSIAFFLALVVPFINIYILKKLLRFHRDGYKFLFILSILALFHKENHMVLETTLLGVMIFLSGFLYLKMFPKKENIKIPKQQAKKDD